MDVGCGMGLGVAGDMSFPHVLSTHAARHPSTLLSTLLHTTNATQPTSASTPLRGLSTGRSPPPERALNGPTVSQPLLSMHYCTRAAQVLQQRAEAKQTGVVWKVPAVSELIQVEVQEVSAPATWRLAEVRKSLPDGRFQVCLPKPKIHHPLYVSSNRIAYRHTPRPHPSQAHPAPTHSPPPGVRLRR